MTESGDVEWTEETLEILGRVPEFAREMARQMIEDFTRDQGEKQITPDIVKRARAKFGM